MSLGEGDFKGVFSKIHSPKKSTLKYQSKSKSERKMKKIGSGMKPMNSLSQSLASKEREERIKDNKLKRVKEEKADSIFDSYSGFGDSDDDDDLLSVDIKVDRVLSQEEKKELELEEILLNSDDDNKEYEETLRKQLAYDQVEKLRQQREKKEMDKSKELQLKSEPKVLSPDEIIKEGVKKGYPERLNEGDIEKRSVRICKKVADKILNQKVSSPFYNKVKKYSLQSKPISIWLHNLVEDNILSGGGYYGPKGLYLVGLSVDEVISAKEILALYKVPDNKWMQKYDVQTIVRAVISPHIITHLIMEDKKISFDEALQVLEQSYNYGLQKFPINENDESRMTGERVVGENGEVLYIESDSYSDSDLDFE